MTAYYDIIDKLNEILSADIAIKTVTKGSIDDVALDKHDLYGLAHIMINSFNPQNNVVTFNVSVIVMDIVDINKETTTNKLRGNDNEDDVLNTMQAVVMRLVEQFRRGDMFEDGYQLDSVQSVEPFTDRFKDKVAGWVITMNINIKHDMTIC